MSIEFRAVPHRSCSDQIQAHLLAQDAAMNALLEKVERLEKALASA